MRALLASGRLEEAAAVEGEPVARESVRLLPPVPDPDKIICIGLNYLSHAREGGNGPPETPTFFAKFRNALAGPGARSAARVSQKVDYEAEVAVVGRRCRAWTRPGRWTRWRVTRCFNDLSARDYQYLTPQWGPGKAFDESGPCGPALVTPDEAGAADAIAFSLELNGETMQSSTTADLIHSVAALLRYLSMLMTLEPGDLICTGTPSGVGRVREPRCSCPGRRGRDLLADAGAAGEPIRLRARRSGRGERRASRVGRSGGRSVCRTLTVSGS